MSFDAGINKEIDNRLSKANSSFDRLDKVSGLQCIGHFHSLLWFRDLGHLPQSYTSSLALS